MKGWGRVIKFDVIVAVSCGRDYNNNNNKRTTLGFSRIVQAMAQTVRLH